jgi:hypothetical protein
MPKLGWRVRLKGTHILGDVQDKEVVGGATMCVVWWDAAAHPDTRQIDAAALENAERRPGGEDSNLYDPTPRSKTQLPMSHRKQRTGHKRI